MILDSFENKEKILTSFLKIAPFEGWSNEALLHAFKECDIEEKFIPIIFENSLISLAEFYIDFYNQKTALEIAKIENFHGKKIREKITLWLYLRFEVEKENKIAIQRLINFYITKNSGFSGKIEGLKACFKIADFIWKDINDQSTDFNFYTKRLTLAKIIFRSLLVFLKDDNDELLKTKNFIDLQIQKVMKFESFKFKTKAAFKEVFYNEKNELKTPKEIIKDLPFFRLFT